MARSPRPPTDQPARTPLNQALAFLLVLAFTTSLLAATTAVHESLATQAPMYDALSRDVPPGMAGPVESIGPLGPLAAAAQTYDVSFETLDVTSDYGPESYKYDHRFNTRTPDDLENQTTNWDNVLGHHIRFTVEVDDGRTTLDCDDQFVAIATIETTQGPLYGWTNGTYRSEAPGGIDDVCLDGLPGVRVYEMVFDLDGSPPTITSTPFPALLTGYYTARLELYHYDPSPTNPTGTGPLAGIHQIGFLIQDPRLSLDQPLYRFPETMLRMIGGTGGHATHTNQFAMPASTLTQDDHWNLTMEFIGTAEGTPVKRIDHYAVRTAPGITPPLDPGNTIGETPLDPVWQKIQQQTERELLGVEIHRNGYDIGTVPASRAATMNLTSGDFTRIDALVDELDHVPLHIVTIHVPASMDTFTTGAESIVVPISDNEHPVRGLSFEDDLSALPTTRLLLQDAQKQTGGPLGLDAGDLFALRPVGSGHETLSRSILQRDVDSQWITGDLPHMDFGEGVTRYRIAALLYGPMDEFYGMRILERGIGLQATDERYVEGTTGRITLTLTHHDLALDGGDVREGIETTIQITGRDLPDGQGFHHNVTLAPGETRSIDVPLTGTTPGSYTARFTATSGELIASTEAPVQLISIEQARAEERRWYEIPAPGALVVLALLGLVLALQRRNR